MQTFTTHVLSFFLKAGLAAVGIAVAVLAEYVFINLVTLHFQPAMLVYGSLLVLMITSMVFTLRRNPFPTPVS